MAIAMSMATMTTTTGTMGTDIEELVELATAATTAAATAVAAAVAVAAARANNISSSSPSPFISGSLDGSGGSILSSNLTNFYDLDYSSTNSASVSLSSSSASSASSASSSASSASSNLASPTASSSSTLADNDDVVNIAFIIGHIVQQYYIPILCCTGTIGNMLSVFVFFKTKLRKLSSSFYLAALAVSDTCFLIGLLVQWLNFFNINIYNMEYFCQFFTFFSYLASFCSVWFVVAFTVERFIAVIYPLKRQTMCTVRRAKMVLAGLTFVGCLHCLPYILIAKPVFVEKLNNTICDLNTEYEELQQLFNYWDSIVVYAVPFTTIAVLNTCTGCTVWKFATVRRTLTMHKMKPQQASSTATTVPSSNSSSSGVTTYRISSSLKRQKSTGTHPSGQHSVASRQQQHQHQETLSQEQVQQQEQHQLEQKEQQQQQEQEHQQHQQHQQHQHQQQQQQHINTCPHHCEIVQKPGRRKVQNSSQIKVTKMLLIVSTVFVFLNLPSCLLRIQTYWETKADKTENLTIALQYVFHALFVTNFGINFVLYCVSGQNFRKAVLSIFRRVSSTQREGVTQVTVSEYCRNTGTSTRRRMMTQHCWNEMHELHPLK